MRARSCHRTNGDEIRNNLETPTNSVRIGWCSEHACRWQLLGTYGARVHGENSSQTSTGGVRFLFETRHGLFWLRTKPRLDPLRTSLFLPITLRPFLLRISIVPLCAYVFFENDHAPIIKGRKKTVCVCIVKIVLTLRSLNIDGHQWVSNCRQGSSIGIRFPKAIAVEKVAGSYIHTVEQTIPR